MTLTQRAVAPRRPAPSKTGVRRPLRAAAGLREARRDANRAQRFLTARLRCECADPRCRATLPAAAEAHRKLETRFIVAPAHAGRDTVVGAADRYFLVAQAGMRFVHA